MEQGDKEQARREARRKRDGLSLQQRRAASLVIGVRVCALPEVRAAQKLLLYCSFRSEVETLGLARHLQRLGKTLTVPLCLPGSRDMLAMLTHDLTRLSPGAFGIPEPEYHAHWVFPPERLDVVFVPGLLFDRAGHRLGYGGGFYDRFLAEKAPQALRVGLAFSGQMVDQVAVEAHDQHLHMVITEREVLRTGLSA